MTLPRIIHVYKDVWPPVEGGIERIIHWMARYTPAEEFEVGIVIASRTRRGGRHALEGVPGVEVTEVPCWGRALSTPLAPGFITALRRARADLLHFHIPHPTGEVAWLLSGLRIPAVATYHSDVVRQAAAMRIYGPVFQKFLGRLRVIMPTSQRYLDTSTALQPHRDRCRVVPLGYPLENYASTPAVAARAAQWRARMGEFVLFLGCLRRYKGLTYLLEALAGLPHARAVIAGDGALRGELETQAQSLGLGERVVFAGRVDDAEAVALLHAASAFVLPAHQRSEAFGLCQIEAMACGLPVISTDLPTGVPEVNRDGFSGLIVPPGDAPALRAAIARLLGDPALRAKLGAGGRARAAAHYSAAQMGTTLAEIYRKILN